MTSPDLPGTGPGAAPARAARGPKETNGTKRADARRNIEAIIAAATRLLAVDPDASISDIAKAAGVGRVTLYGHFDSRAALIGTVVDRAITDSEQALARLDLSGSAREALGRLLESTWHLTHRYGALIVAASTALSPDQVRRAHDEPAARVRDLIRHGRATGEFRAGVPLEWQVSLVQAIVHTASAAAYRHEITADEAPALVRDTVLAALAA